MGSHRGRNEMRLLEKWRRKSHLPNQSTKSAFLINVLILMAFIRDIEVVAIHAPHITHVGRSVRDNAKEEETYQSNYEDGAATVSGLSTGYTVAHNYYRNAASHSVADDIPTYGDTVGNAARFANLQQFRDANDIGFIPTTMTAAGQHFVVPERDEKAEQAGHNVVTSPQIGGVHAAGPYRVPAGKIDYEINAANYDVASETANGMKADEQNTGVIETNDALNIAMLQNMVHLQQQQQRQQQIHQQQHQLAYAAENTPAAQDAVDEMFSLKNDDAPTATMSNKYTERNQQQHEQPNINEQYLHNLEMLRYANYEHKPTESANIYTSKHEILLKGGQQHTPYSFISYEPPKGHNVFRINQHSHQHNQRQQHRQQNHQNYDNNVQRVNAYNGDNFRSQTQHQYTHEHTPPTSHSRSLNLQDSNNVFNSIQLPPITQTLHHTPASSAAIADIPLSRHVEVVRHVPVTHYKREHIPYNRTVPIEIPQPIITTVPKPIPINIPVPQTVAVPQLKVLHIPVEKIKAMPVERKVPFLVEKRVPYEVEKPVAKPVYYPYPIRVPIVTTVIHKLPHNSYHHQQPWGHHHQPLAQHHHHHTHPRRLFYTHVISKSGH